MSSPAEWPEIGSDQLDPALARVNHHWWAIRLPRRAALGTQPTTTPLLLFVGLGVALGPYGLNLVTAHLLEASQAVSWVALGVIGVFIGFGLATSATGTERTTFLTAAVIAVVTVGGVAGGLFVLATRTHAPLFKNLFTSSLLIGLCASVSAALPAIATGGELRRASDLADLDDAPVVVFGTLAVAVIAGGAVWLRMIATIAGSGAIALAGWLLLQHANDSERGLFVTGTVLLLAGVGAYLGTSPLLCGCVASLVWARIRGGADRVTARDLRVLQHPLVALLLITAGALTQWTAPILWLSGCVLVLRLVAKLSAALVVHRLIDISPALLATTLLHPGIMGIALAVNVTLVGGSDYAWVLSTVTASAVASEVLSSWLPPMIGGDA